MATNINSILFSLKDMFKEKVQITVTSHGPVDAFGYAGCKLSNGDQKLVRYPFIDKVVGYEVIEPEMTKNINSDEVTIKVNGKNTVISGRDLVDSFKKP